MKIADSITYCSSCHGQYLDRKHVDFESYFDGPVIDAESGIKVSIDDLIICDQCLQNAGKLVGLFPADELKKENEELGTTVEEKNAQIEVQHELISDLEKTLAKFTDEKIQRPDRRPRMVEVT